MLYEFDKVLDRRNTNCEKWDNLMEVFGREDVVSLWVADMDFASPPEVVEALAERAQHPTYGYTFPSQSLREAAVGWISRRHGWEIDPEWIVITPGVVPGLAISVLAYTQPGDGVVVQSPVYPPFFRVVESNGRRLLNNELRMGPDGRYAIDWDDLQAKLDDGARLVLLCSPANPVGRVWTDEELARLADMCRARDVIVASDEIHCDIVYFGARHIPLGSLGEGVAHRSVTFMAPSKTFNVQGLTTSMAIIPSKQLRERFARVQLGLGMAESNIFGLTAFEAAYRRCDVWLDRALEYLEGNLRYLQSFASSRLPGITVVPAEGMYVVWLDCRGLGLDADALRDFLVNRARVGVNDGRMFGPGGEGFARINIGCSRAILREGLERIEEALRQLR
ncbi:MAG TPA: PatB family C-S lyase [Bacillota bacterium]|nr:PatB family C-S lyase [Bacillota bacterium]